MRTVNLSETTDKERAGIKQIEQNAQVNLNDCYQCGKCSAGCPMAEAMDVPPQQVMGLLQLGKLEEVFEATSPFICAQCNTCSSRCPQNIDTAAVMREVRRASYQTGHHRRHDGSIFENLFIGGLRSNGRSNEQYLAASYNVMSGHFTQDLFNAPKMMARKMIGIAPQSNTNSKAIAEIIKRCEEQHPYTDGMEGADQK